MESNWYPSAPVIKHMNKQSKDAADILQFGIAYPYGFGCQETPDHGGMLNVALDMMLMC